MHESVLYMTHTDTKSRNRAYKNGKNMPIIGEVSGIIIPKEDRCFERKVM